MPNVTQFCGLLCSGLALLVSVAGVLVAYLRGDVAAQKASEKLQAEGERRERLTALQSLLNEVDRAEKVASLNAEQVSSEDPQLLIFLARMPTTAFETAFTSGQPGVEAGRDLVDLVTQYLALADVINARVAFYPKAAELEPSGRQWFQDVQREIEVVTDEQVLPILAELSNCIKEDMQRISEQQTLSKRALP